MKAAITILVGLVLLTAVSCWWLFGRVHNSIETTRVDQPIAVSAHVPLLLGGPAYVVASGEIDGTAKVEIFGNRGFDHQEFVIGPGPFKIARGGAEAWIAGYHFRYTPVTAKNGRVYVSVYCGSGMEEADRMLYDEVSRRN